MTTEVPTKLRLVRCPKCRKVLPELPNIPVYQCGGCGTILQAKRRKNNIKDTESLDHETDRSLERSSEDREARRSNQEELSSPGALVLNENNTSDEIEAERNRKQTGEIEVSSELPQKEDGNQCREVRLSDGAASSIELDHPHESAESSPVSEGHSAMTENATSSELDNQPNQNMKQPGGSNIANEVVSSTEVDHEYRERKQPEDLNFSDQVASSTELNRHRSERSSVDTTSLNEEDENQDFVEESKRDDESDSAEKVDGITISLEQCTTRDEVVASSAELNHFQSQRSSVDSKTRSEEDVEESSPITTGLDVKLKKPISSESWSDENLMSSVANRFSSESFSTDGLMSPHDEHTAQDQNRPRESWSGGSSRSSIPHRFSGESFLTDGLMSPRNQHSPEDQTRDFDGNDMSEHLAFTGRDRDGLKSRTTSINYAYEGSASSSDETDDSLRRVHLSERKLKEAEAEAGVTKTEGVDKIRSGFPATQPHGGRNSLSISPENNRHAARSMKRDEGVDNIRSGFPATQPHGRNSSSVSPENNRHAARSMKRDEGVDNIRSGFPATQPHGRNSLSISPENNRHAARSMKRDEGINNIRSGFPATQPHGGRNSSSVSPENNRYFARSMKRDEGADKIRSGFPTMQPHGRNSSSVSPENNRHAAGTSRWHQEELETLATNALPVRSRTRFQTGEGTSKLPHYSKSSRAGYENRNHPNYVRRGVGSASSKRPEDLEKEKIELLKKVYELQIELKETKISRFPPEAGTRRDLSHTRSAFSCNQGRRPYQARDSRIPFSAEAMIPRSRQDDAYCLHCCPQDWQLQPLLPPHSCCNKAHTAFHSGRRSHNLHHSATSSPRHYATSEASDDHWHRDHEAKRIHREKTHSTKRHVRPVVGGAPLVACYKCFEVLQLPADFLLFKRKVHQLQCSGCSAILKFSLLKGSRIVPYKVYTAADDDVEAVAPPPSEVDAFSDPKFGSEDYGSPKSYSNGRTVSSGSTYEPVEEKRKEESLLRGLGKKIYSHAGTFSSSSKTSKSKRGSSEIRDSSGSPLHKLMGYASPSKVMER